MPAPLPPGHDGLPLLGETLQFAKNTFAFIEDRFKRHGPVFRSNVLGEKVAFFVGPEAFTVFLDPQNFTRADASPKPLRELLHWEAVPFLDGEKHKERKRALMAAVGPSALPRYQAAIEKAVASTLERIAGKDVRLSDEMGRLAFGLSDALFAGANPETVNEPMRLVFNDFVAGVIALPIKLPFTAYGKALKARDVMSEYLGAVARRSRAAPRDDVMSGLVQAGLSDEEARNEALHFFFAGYGGMHAWLTWLFHAFATNPSVEAACRADARPDSALLDRVCREVKRLYPVIPFTFFARALRDVEHAGVRVPAGWKAMGCTYSTLHDGARWKDPERFDPDRFARGEQNAHPNLFVPQGGGPVDGHRCAGEALADVLLKTMAVQYLRGYRMEVAPGQDLGVAWGTTPPLPRGGLRAKLVRA